MYLQLFSTHRELSEEVYMRQAEGFIESGKENLACQLKCSIYGLKQSPRCWNHALDSQLREMGFTQTASVYIQRCRGDAYCGCMCG